MPFQGHSGSSRPQGSSKNGYAAIDFGSTSTRAYLTTVDTKTKQTKGYRVQKTGVDDDKKKRFLRGEWPSKGCPFDAPYPVGYDAAGKEHADKRDRSLKSFVWFLADDDDQHPYTRDLKDYHDSLTGGVQEKQKFRKRLMNMLVCHLSIVADQIRQEAVLRQTAIRRLVLCVPNAWDKPNFQKVLRPIMDNVARGIETYCVFESEALSQFILHQHSYLLKDHDYVLVCDFGGHFMLSTKIPPEWRMTHTAQDMLCTLARLLRLTLHFQGGSLFQFCREGPEDDHPAFFSLPQGNFGVRGGSQLWEDHVRPIIDEHLKTLGLAPERTSILRAKFLDGFYMKKSEVDQSFYEKRVPMRVVVSITDAFPDDTKLYTLYLKPGDLHQAWERGFRESLDLAIEKIRQLPVSSRDKTVIILSGGSMQNCQARAELLEVCRNYGIEARAVGFDVNPESSKWMVCEGAAMSEACAMSVRDFFQRGAALAVQSYTRDGVYKANAQVLFYGARARTPLSRSWTAGSMDHSEPLFEYEVGSLVEIELGGVAHNRIRLVCDPLYQQNSNRYLPGLISIHSDDIAVNNNCYDIWDVSRRCEEQLASGTQVGKRLPPGKYLLRVDEMAYNDNGVDATLRLRMTRQVVATESASLAITTKNLRARTTQQRLPTGETYTFDLPLTFCGPSNLILLDLDLVKQKRWRPQQSAGTHLPLSVAEPESWELVEEEEDCPATKRQRTLAPSPEDDDESYTDWENTETLHSAKHNPEEPNGARSVAYLPEGPVPQLSYNAPDAPAIQAIIQSQAATDELYARDSNPKFGSNSSESSHASIHATRQDLEHNFQPLRETYLCPPSPAKSNHFGFEIPESEPDSDFDDYFDDTVARPRDPVRPKGRSNRWTDAEVSTMLRERVAGRSYGQIAAVLQRGKIAIQMKFSRVVKTERWHAFYVACGGRVDTGDRPSPEDWVDFSAFPVGST